MEARRAHLAREKELTRLRDEIARERRELPWVRVEKPYVFETTKGRETLAQLFGGASAFYRDAGNAVFHTYSAYARGLDLQIGTYNWLDLAPKGRDEDALGFTMAWVRHHDRYGEGAAVGAKAQSVPPVGPPSCCG